MGMFKRESIIVLIVALLVSSCFISAKCSTSTVLDYGWSMFGYNASRTGFSEDVGSSSGARNWEVGWSDSMLDSPAVAYGCVYYKIGHLVCYNAFTGETVWEAENEAASDIWSVAVANGYVYADSNGYVYALNASTGEEVWTCAFGNDEELYAPTVADGEVYVGCSDNNLYAFDATDGSQLWNYTTGAPVESSPVSSKGVVYATSNDGNIYAIDAAVSNKIWNSSIGREAKSGFLSSPAVSDDVVYVGSNTHVVYALDALTGTKIWSTDIGWMFSTPAVAYGSVYVASAHKLYAMGTSRVTSKLTVVLVPELLIVSVVIFVIFLVLLGIYRNNRGKKSS